MVSVPTRERNKRGEGERLREALLDAASSLLAEGGDIERLSIRAVTARAGVTATALYLHFSDKDDLGRELKKRCFAELGDVLAAAEERHAGDPLKQLHAMGLAYLGYAREHPGHYALMFQPAKRKPRRAAPADVRAAGAALLSRVAEAVARLVGDGAEAHEAAAALWLALHGRAAIEQAMPFFEFSADATYVERLLNRL